MTRTQLTNPFSTGGGGVTFEARVQAAFAALMLAGGFVPGVRAWPIRRLQTQAKHLGYETDDLVVWVQDPASSRQRRLLVQVKHRIGITKTNATFASVIDAAWADFNNSELFTQGEDRIALVTGPVTLRDEEVRDLLEWARATHSPDEFVRRVERANHSSVVKREKLEAFRVALSKAQGRPVTNEELHRFLRHFHLLGYDLDLESGVALSLLHSLIGQYSPENAQMLWSRIVDEMQSLNMRAGEVTRETIAEDLRDVFVTRPPDLIPIELSVKPQIEAADWSSGPHAATLALAVLLGGWDEAKDADVEVIEKLTRTPYAEWVLGLREALVASGSPLTFSEGKWGLVDRGGLWGDVAPLLFDDTVSRFEDVALAVLRERDPRFDLPLDERYAAAVHGKLPRHSHELRRGIAEGLAVLSNRSGQASRLSRGKADTVAAMTVRQVLSEADGVGWAGLNEVLPLLAEASPNEFLDAVESGLEREPCPFDDVFSQEGSGITGQNYTTGLLWGLELLAWDPELLVRVVVVLGDLASCDPGGNCANRPENSIRTILLPWLPQTLAPPDKRIVAARTLAREHSAVGWTLLLSLLPNQHQTSSGSFKPVWRETIPEEWEKGVSGGEYWEQVGAYSDMVVEMARGDVARMQKVIDCLSSLPRPAFDSLLELLSSDEVRALPESERVDLWESLVALANKHTKFAHTDWALPAEAIERVEDVAAGLAPEDMAHRYRRYFCGRDHDLFEAYDDYDHERDKLEQARRDAVRDLLQERGVDGVVAFAQLVEARWQLGRVLGTIGNTAVDDRLLPQYLDTSDAALGKLAVAYCRSRHASLGWSWADGLDRQGWTPGQVAGFLASLPFAVETWNRVDEWLGASRSAYWTRTSASPYEIDAQHDRAVGALMGHKRPLAALRVLHWHLHDSGELNIACAVQALMAAPSSKEPPNQLSAYEMVELIKALQERNPDIEELPTIEWAYLALLDGTHGATPIVLDRKLASDPSFFMEAIRLVYRSKEAAKRKRSSSEKEREQALNAWRLLHQWRLVPGSSETGGVSAKDLKLWLEAVRGLAKESGHLEAALTHVGHVLFHAPADDDGLWIDRAVAQVLNARDNEDVRNGYQVEAFNSRGVHWVDPTGAPERELASAYRAKAEAVENVGFQRLAATLRQLADSYDADAERIVKRHQDKSEDDDDS